MTKIITRFAPSPTGYLHIGGARTALFNWLFARHHAGRFILRIEDTDKERNTPAAVQAIVDGMAWLGLDHDGDVVYQSHRADRHREIAMALLDKGAAYRCYMTAEQIALQKSRNPHQKVVSPYHNLEASGRSRDPYTIRLRAEQAGTTIINDAVQGRVEIDNSTLDDMILLRSDGTPTYMLAVVVDDHDAGITHVIRGDDHLNNAFRQLGIIRGMGWQEPIYAHIPLIHDEDGKKVSKRKGAVGVEDYAAQGILPDAMFNYLLKLGWGHGDDEVISRAQATAWFDLDAVGRAPARLNAKKLQHLNGVYLRATDNDALIEQVMPFLAPKVAERAGTQVGTFDHYIAMANIVRVYQRLDILKERATDLNTLADRALFLILPPEVNVSDPILRAVLRVLEALWDNWAADTLEDAIRALAETHEMKLKDVVAPLRMALTGSTMSPPIFATMVALGRSDTIDRVSHAIRMVSQP